MPVLVCIAIAGAIAQAVNLGGTFVLALFDLHEVRMHEIVDSCAERSDH